MVGPSRAVFLLFCLFVNGEETQKNTLGKVIIDNDAGGDDATAIFLALLNEKYNNGPKIIGLTTVKGNTIESNVNINNQRILKVAKRQDIPIYRGAKDSLLKEFESECYFGVDGLGDSGEEITNMVPAHEKNAVSALIELSKTHAGELSVLTLGPLTNIAIALRLDPEFIGRLAHLYIGAGHIHSDNFPTPEFNAQFDIDAYHIVLQNSNPDKVTLLPFSQVQLHLNYSKSWRQDVLGGINNDIVKAMNKYEKVSLKNNERWIDLDPAVVAAAVKPNLVKEYKYSKNDIIWNGGKRGIVSNELVDKEKANARIIYSMKSEDYRIFLLSVFSAEK
ncbi:uncharacterized protein [Choristoneura fumiferana]|uniref:uncharacterized protein n=1 Tax=Choristoneura fumiferana TaxID=7141 RepID=UPI003D1583AE